MLMQFEKTGHLEKGSRGITMNRADLIFTEINNVLEKINDPKSFENAIELIKKAALEVNGLNREKCFSVTYIKKFTNESYDHFMKAMKVKARDATGIVPSIDSCSVVEKLPMGFRREIKIGEHAANQRVWELKNENSFLIVFKTNGIKFIATNELEKRKNETTFIARYIVDAHPNPKYNTPESFLELVMNPTYGNLERLSSSNKLNEEYNRIVGENRS